MQLDLVDVFGADGNTGNPLAVVHNADLDDAAMLALTRWIGFSETTFLIPPSDPAADYHVRIFTPGRELPFAGHPTLGSCHAWLAAGGQPKDPTRIIQQCGVGLVPVARDGDTLAFRAPPLIKSGPLDAAEAQSLADWAHVPHSAIQAAVDVDNGPGWQLLHLSSAMGVLAAKPTLGSDMTVNLGLVGAYPQGQTPAYEVRAFFTMDHGQVVEDPVTGSLNAGIAQYLFETGAAQSSYIAGQGQSIGRNGHVHARRDANGDVWIGGRTTTVAAGGHLIA